MSEFIPVNVPLISGNEKKYLSECIDTAWVSSEGPFVTRFEDSVAQTVNRSFGVSVSSGSAALDVAVTALGLGKGDEVIMPAFTIISCASAIVRAGAVPVLVDCDEFSWNMNVRDIEARITSKTRAIMVVHIYGLPVDMDGVLELAEKHNLKIIEDAAEAIGQTYKNRPCGSFGDISIFSFYANKHVTTGEGGMVLTDDPGLAERARSLRNLCFIPEQRFVHEELGWNFRMSNLQAALGLAQLEKLQEHREFKKSMGRLYAELLKGISGLQLPLAELTYAENDFWVYGVVIEPEHEMNARDAMEALSAQKVGTRPFFWPMHEQPALRKLGLFADESHPVSERIARRGFYLPGGLGMTHEQITEVAHRVRTVFE
jgi:perosamine synthetase